MYTYPPPPLLGNKNQLNWGKGNLHTTTDKTYNLEVKFQSTIQPSPPHAQVNTDHFTFLSLNVLPIQYFIFTTLVELENCSDIIRSNGNKPGGPLDDKVNTNV